MKSTAILCAIAFILAPFSIPGDKSTRFTAGQGLNVGSDNLGAGVAATALEFETFESALELATTGGKGRFV
jgi:hypothetical protein